LVPEFHDQFDQYLARIRSEGFAKGVMAVQTRTGERRIWQYHNTLQTQGVAAPIVRGIAHDVTEQKKAQQQLVLRLRETTFLSTLGRRLSRSMSLSSVVEAAIEGVVDTLRPDSALFFLRENESLRLRAMWSRDPEFKPEGRRAHVLGLCLSGLAAREGKRVCFSNIFGNASCALDESEQAGLRSIAALPLTSENHVIGVIGLVSSSAVDFEGQAAFLSALAAEVSMALRNTLLLEEAKERGVELERQVSKRRRAEEVAYQNEQRLRMLLRINNALVSNLELSDLFPALSSALRTVFQQNFAGVGLYDREQDAMRIFAADLPLGEGLVGAAVPMSESLTAQALRAGEIKLFRRPDLEHVRNEMVSRLLADGFHSICCIPLKTPKKTIGALALGSRKAEAFVTADFQLMMQIAAQVALAVDNAHANQEIAKLKGKLAEEKLYLENQIQSGPDFEEIIGESAALKQALGLVSRVAPVDSTVLLLGETGTGKELFARAIHRMSTRRGGSFIRMNCAAIPTGLLESELFGHEKGAFTGAIAQKLGRLEMADKGTLFLDEVGEIPLELQPKLLRVLQDHEFERLGSTRTVRVDLRLITATNRDLSRSVVEKKFRSDLFYRLNVFPIRLPALRERRTDIPMLVAHFVQKYAERIGKKIDRVPRKTMEALMRSDWPGNIRELENVIERSVILTPGSVLQVPLPELSLPKTNAGEETLELAKREHIIRALRESRGLLSGPNGAAKRLGLRRTTLQSTLKRMGISPLEYRDDGFDPPG